MSSAAALVLCRQDIDIRSGNRIGLAAPGADDRRADSHRLPGLLSSSKISRPSHRCGLDHAWSAIEVSHYGISLPSGCQSLRDNPSSNIDIASMDGDSEVELVQRSNTEGSTAGSEDHYSSGARERANTSATRGAYEKSESHQFEQNESEVWWHHQFQR